MKYRKKIPKEEFIQLIKKKKEFSGLANSVVQQTLESYLTKNLLSFSSIPPSQLKILLKELRSQLRVLTGRFQKKVSFRNKTTDFSELLKTHASTAERLAFYHQLKNKISSLKINSILDLGCGLNPLALASPELKYYAADINESELEIIGSFFKKNNISGKTFVFDIRNISAQAYLLPKTDLCIIFKVLDILGKAKRVLTEEILKKVPSKLFLISFSTKKLSGKPMNYPKRFWFEKVLKNLSLPFEQFSSSNEIFYLIIANHFNNHTLVSDLLFRG